MNERTLRVLEYKTMIEKLVAFGQSEAGKNTARQLLPTTDFQEINRRFNETSEAVSMIQRKGAPSFIGNIDIQEMIKRMQIGSILHPSELLKLANSLKTAREVKLFVNEEFMSEYNGEVKKKIQELFTQKPLEERIFSSILSEEEIDDHASPSLLSIRRSIHNHQNSIRQMLTAMIRSATYQKYIQDPVVTIRQGRYCVSVKQEHRNEIRGLIHDTSASGATLFIEPMAVVDANNEIKQLKHKEQVEIERILAELTQECDKFSHEFLQNVTYMTDLDFIFAKAKLSLSYQGIKPRLNQEKRIQIREGRHPLIHKNTVVPVDFDIGGDIDSVVITGPNTGGKTVLLKTVGLFTLMAQSGLYIPAKEGTELGIFQNIFADIGDEQSIMQSLSTFSSHMKHVIEIVTQVDSTSLVLLDELGAGTDPTEGSSLAMAILEYLQQRGVISLATTHYSELKGYAMARTGVLNASCEFDLETLHPTYKILIGVPGKSNAFAIAERLGLPDSILSMAKNHMTKEELQIEDMLYDIHKNLSETEKNKLLIQAMLEQIQKEELKVKMIREKLESDKQTALKQAKEEALRIVREAKQQAGAIVKELNTVRSAVEDKRHFKEVEKLKQKLQNMEQANQANLEDRLVETSHNKISSETFQVGDYVFLSHLQQNGEVLSLPNKNGEVFVQVGSMKTSVAKQYLQKIKREDTKTHASFKGIAISKTKTIQSEVDVRGLIVGDAIEIVDKYLDDAILAGLTEVRIIHGKGTGALRDGLKNYFKTHPHIIEFRYGQYGEGETGVTIITLK